MHPISKHILSHCEASPTGELILPQYAVDRYVYGLVGFANLSARMVNAIKSDVRKHARDLEIMA